MSAAQQGELVHAAPGDLVIDTNVRTAPDIDPAFLQSITEHGVRTPVTGWRDDAGQIHVEMGQRRTLAAVTAGRDTIPVYLLPKDQAQEAAAAERERIIAQLSENDHRAPLTDAQHVASWNQLTLFGMSADEIARATGTKRDRVRAAVKLVKEAPETAAALQSEPMTLDQALTISEFEQDAEARRRLVEAFESEPELVPAIVHALRAEQKAATALAECQQEAAELGVEWVDPKSVHIAGSGYIRLADLRIGDAAAVPTVEEAIAQGGVVASMTTHSRWTGTGYESTYELSFHVGNPRAHGYRTPRQGVADTRTPEERERELEAKRRRRANRKAWVTSTELRHSWIKDELLTLRKMPAGALLWVVKAFLDSDESLAYFNETGREKARGLVIHWMGLDEKSIRSNWGTTSPDSLIAAGLAQAGDAELRLALAYALAGTEARISDEKAGDFGEARGVGRYLLQLHEWGYPLTAREHELSDGAILAEQTEA